VAILRKTSFRLSLFALLFVGFAAAWRLTPLASFLDLETLRAAGATLQEHPWGGSAVLAAFIAGGLLMMPINLLILALALLIGPQQAFVQALLGCIAIAAAGYGAGAWLGARREAPVSSGFRGWLLRRGLFSLMLLRNVPMGPFNAVNVAAGAIGLRFSRFLLATALGMIPGIAAIVLVGRGVATGAPAIWAGGAAAAVLLALSGRFLRRRVAATELAAD
jgi:uncharacterized membrane protein YdjX (TVP38/TMEM64 family)